MKIQIHEHGSVELVDSMGSDADIIRAARMSVQTGFKGWGTDEAPGDERLLRHLWKHRHTSPFEFCSAVFEIKAPIFVFREWHRHRTQSYSEASARYSPLANQDYLPQVERLLERSTTNKQAGSSREMSLDEAIDAQHIMADIFIRSEDAYQKLLEMGVARELARGVLTVSRYSTMRASANLLNWTRFMNLRQDPTAQSEIRCYADAINVLLTEKFPKTMQLFNESK